MFVRCSLCGKQMLKRQDDGLWRFMFGRNKEIEFIPVDMIIYGSIKMRCLRRKCRRENPGHWNIFQMFPHKDNFQKSTTV